MNAESARPPHILVVDDEPAMRDMVVDYLERYEMSAVSASGRQEMTRHFAARNPSLVILDRYCGEQDGFDLLREIRSRSDVPVIIVTGHQSDYDDRAVGLELGADDYVTKPFGLRELLARIRAVLRRAGIGNAPPSRDRERGRYRFCGWQLDRSARCLTDPSGAAVALTNREYSLLTAFLDAPHRPLSRAYLLRATRVHEDVFDRSIDVSVLRLRRKLGTDLSSPSIIETERGVGYTFTPAVERA